MVVGLRYTLYRETSHKSDIIQKVEPVSLVVWWDMFLTSRKTKLVLLAICLGILYWILESAVMASLHNEEFTQLLFFPNAHELRERLLATLFFLAFAFHADFLIGRREKAYDALRASEDKYRHLVELSPDAIAIQCDDRIVFMNPAGAKLFGAEKVGALLGKSVWDFVLPENKELVRMRYRQMRETGIGAQPIEQRFQRLDGACIDLEVSAVPFVHDGKPAIQAILRDITERKKAGSELVRLRKAVETSGDVIFLTDRDGIITYVNPEFTRVYGFAKEEVVGKTTPRILKSGSLTSSVYEAFWETILNKKVVKGAWINRCKDGKLINIEGSANPILGETGNIIGFLAIQRDITERVKMEEKIQQRNKELQTLYQVAATVNYSDNLNRILNDALNTVLQLDWLGGDARGMLFLFDRKKKELSLAAHYGAPLQHPCLYSSPKLGECLCGLVVQQNEAIVSNDSSKNPRHSRNWPEMDKHKDVCVPVQARGAVVGALNVRLPITQEIADSDISLLKSVASQIGLAIENAKLHELNESAIYAERERIARDLHDDMGQLLSYVNTKSMAARLHLKNWQLIEAQKNLADLEDTVKRMSMDLRKAILDLKSSGSGKINSDLVTTLENYITQFNHLSNLNVRLDVISEIEDFIIPPETVMQILRIVQEALTNVLKHAKTTEVCVTLNSADGFIELSITDQGSGFDASRLGQTSYPHFGMDSMRERVDELGGTFKVIAKPAAGTEVIVSIPVEKRELS